MDMIIFVKADLLCTRETHRLKALLDFLKSNSSNLKCHTALDVSKDGVVSATPADYLFDHVPQALFGHMIRHNNYYAVSIENLLDALQDYFS